MNSLHHPWEKKENKIQFCGMLFFKKSDGSFVHFFFKSVSSNFYMDSVCTPGPSWGAARELVACACSWCVPKDRKHGSHMWQHTTCRSNCSTAAASWGPVQNYHYVVTVLVTAGMTAATVTTLAFMPEASSLRENHTDCPLLSLNCKSHINLLQVLVMWDRDACEPCQLPLSPRSSSQTEDKLLAQQEGWYHCRTHESTPEQKQFWQVPISSKNKLIRLCPCPFLCCSWLLLWIRLLHFFANIPEYLPSALSIQT